MNINGSTSDLADKLKPVVNTLRIIVLALASGVLVFACVAAAVRMSQPQQPANDMAALLTTLAIVLAPLALLAKGILPGMFVKQARARIAAGKFEVPVNPRAGAAPPLVPELADAGRFFVVYQTHTIIGAAMLEGVAFLSLTAFMLNGSTVALALGLLLVAAIVAMVPRMPRVVQWINEQLRLLDEEKLLVR
jgi:hypothetical protein